MLTLANGALLASSIAGPRVTPKPAPIPVAPVAAGALPDLALTQGVAMTPLDVAADFSSTEPVAYTLAPSSDPPPAGLALSGAGLLSGTPTTPVTGAAIVVRGTNAYGFADTAFSVTVTAAALVPQLAPNLPLGPLLTGAPDDIGGASWTSILTPTVTAGTSVKGVTPYEMTTGTDGGRQRYGAFVNTAIGDALVAVLVGKPVSGDTFEVGIQTVSDNNRVRARVMANAAAGTPTYNLTVIGGDQATMIENHALGLERLADGFVRLTLIVSRKAITANARTYPFWGTGGVASTVEGWRCGLFELERPAASALVVGDTEIALSLGADWGGWALGATVEYRVDGGTAVAVPEPGITIIPVAGPGTYTIERREVWPQASVPGISPLMAAGGSQFETLWKEVV